VHYTILHLGSGQEVYERKQKFHTGNWNDREEYYELKTFPNIREVRNYINKNRFYEDSTGMIVSKVIHRWDKHQKSENQCSKHTLQAKQYV
jgi:hypothetical protein